MFSAIEAMELNKTGFYFINYSSRRPYIVANSDTNM